MRLRKSRRKSSPASWVDCIFTSNQSGVAEWSAALEQTHPTATQRCLKFDAFSVLTLRFSRGIIENLPEKKATTKCANYIAQQEYLEQIFYSSSCSVCILSLM